MQKQQPNRICCCGLKVKSGCAAWLLPVWFQTAGVIVAFVEFLLCVLAVYGIFRNYHIFGWPYFFWFVVGRLAMYCFRQLFATLESPVVRKLEVISCQLLIAYV